RLGTLVHDQLYAPDYERWGGWSREELEHMNARFAATLEEAFASGARKPRCVVWRGRDPYEDINSLADAAAATGELFDRDGVVVWLSDKGELVPAGGPVLREVIGRRVVTLRLVNCDRRLGREYRPVVGYHGGVGMAPQAGRR